MWPRFNSRGALWGALAGMISMAVFTILDILKIFSIGTYIYLATFGFLVTLAVAVFASLTGQSKYYGAPGWALVPTASNRKDLKLDDTDRKVLELIRVGHCYMADLTDALGVDSKTSGKAIENLDQSGCIVRAGFTGSKFYTFSITEKGQGALAPLSVEEAKLAALGLTPMYLELLRLVKDNPEMQAEFVRKYGVKSMQMSSICSHLTRQGYITEGGLFKRKLHVTQKGLEAVKQYV
ncbi:hypothetical protein SDC9_121687 [bioreactor metagenome]|uniref:Uncharacterized protein n=1 Tax=bioreactor metagenome TaxID=1076179 RepID=A0A645CCS9_9ZZZZ